jgi:hypothetical protein
VASIWHIGLAVPGLEGKKELSDVFGLSWRPTRVRTLTLVDAYGRPYDVECHVAFSIAHLHRRPKKEHGHARDQAYRRPLRPHQPF